MLAGQDLLVVLVIALIVFGPKKLPELMKTIGKTLGELKKTTDDMKESMGIKELEGIRSKLTGMDLFTDLAEKVSTSMTDQEGSEQVPASMHDSVPAKSLPPDLAVDGERDKDKNEKLAKSKDETSLVS